MEWVYHRYAICWWANKAVVLGRQTLLKGTHYTENVVQFMSSGGMWGKNKRGPWVFVWAEIIHFVHCPSKHLAFRRVILKSPFSTQIFWDCNASQLTYGWMNTMKSILLAKRLYRRLRKQYAPIHGTKQLVYSTDLAEFSNLITPA